MTSLLSSESLDDFTSLTLIAIAHSPQPIAGFQTAFVQHGNLLLARINQCLPVHDDLHNRQALVLPILGSAVASPGYPGESGGQSDCCRLWPETLQFAQPNQRTTVTAMSINLTPRIVTDLKPKFEIK